MQFVLERWCKQWYMARIIEKDHQSVANNSSSLGASGQGDQFQAHEEDKMDSTRIIKVHAFGDSIAADKEFTIDSENIVFLEVLLHDHQVQLQQQKLQHQSPRTGHLFDPHGGEFPSKHDHVEIYIADKEIAPFLRAQRVFLVGQVLKVFPNHDTSLVDVTYPARYHVVQRKIHINNGYIRIISLQDFQLKRKQIVELELGKR